MKTEVQAFVRVEAVAGAEVGFLDEMEMALDCPICRRNRRTIIFGPTGVPGACMGKGHNIDGCVTSKTVTKNGDAYEAAYNVTYDYQAFLDAKKPDPSMPIPSWGRIHFWVRCPQCDLFRRLCTQSNISRPWGPKCVCGLVLFREKDEMPIRRRLGTDGVVVEEITETTSKLVIDELGDVARISPECYGLLGIGEQEARDRVSRGVAVFEIADFRCPNTTAAFARLGKIALALDHAKVRFQFLSHARPCTESYLTMLKTLPDDLLNSLDV